MGQHRLVSLITDLIMAGCSEQMSQLKKVDECFFGCKSTSKTLISGRAERIISASNERKDQLHVDLEQAVKTNPNLTVRCHKNCISSYTSSFHIQLYLKRQNKDNSSIHSDEPAPAKRSRRSNSDTFDFMQHCIFCGEICSLNKDSKHPDRHRRVVLCKTAVYGKDKTTLKDVILNACHKRQNETAAKVQIRLQGALSDLHAADARYHKDCYTAFMAPRSIESAGRYTERKDDVDEAFQVVVEMIKADPSVIRNTVELFQKYVSNGGNKLTKRFLLQKLSDVFGPELLILSSPGIASIVVLRSEASSILKLVDDEDNENVLVEKVAKQIASESKISTQDKDGYNTSIDLDSCLADVSPTLCLLLTSISKKLNMTLHSAMIGSIITSAVTNKPTSLQVALGVKVREKSLIENLYSLGVTCSYYEVLRFKSSAAAATTTKTELRGLSAGNGGLIQAVADNFDANISSQNGLKSTHALALLLTQPKMLDNNPTPASETITRISKQQMKEPVIPDIPIYKYEGEKKPKMPPRVVQRTPIPLKVLVSQKISLWRAQEIDFHFLKTVVSEAEPLEFGGYNTKEARTQGHSTKPSTQAIYTPLIDMLPADLTTMMTAMMEAKRLTKEAGQNITIFTCDQQLYRVSLNVLWAYPELFPDVLLRLGGMHFLMSFVGAVGTLMSNSGLEELLTCAFGGVNRMLSGKNFPQNIRALRMVVELLLIEVHQEAESGQCLTDILEEKATVSRTSKHWIDNLIKPVLLMMLFIRAEREGDWPLHLYAVQNMLPYFFASGHFNYCRYGLYYLRSVEHLPAEILNCFLAGEHVMRHQAGLWNGMWSDMFIETTFMRYGHGPGGIIGITLNEGSLKRWALSLHICSKLTKDLVDMCEGVQINEVTHHKEERTARRKSDKEDRDKLLAKLNMSIHPLDIDSHPNGIVNIVTGTIGPPTVNVDDSVKVGKQQMALFEEKWPQSFHQPLHHEVVTMSVTKKHIKVGSSYICDPELIFIRVLGLHEVRPLCMKDVLQYELSPVPCSMFNENGEMRLAKNKSSLKRKLQVEVSERLCQKPDALIIDGCAILWVVYWPAEGTVQDYTENFAKYIMKKLKHQDVYLVFDRYYDGSIKSYTRSERAQNIASRPHRLTLKTKLPPQKVALSVTGNKIQLIDAVCKYLLTKAKEFDDACNNKLIITQAEPVPIEVHAGATSRRYDLETTHEEADVIIVQQATALAKAGKKAVRILCDDTDVFVLLLHFYCILRLTCQMTMEAIHPQRTVVDIGMTVDMNTTIIVNVLAAHAITGCDTVPCMFGIGKISALKVLNDGFSLVSLGNQRADFEQALQECTSFVAACYGCRDVSTMNEARLQVWNTKVSNAKTSMPKLKSLPPTTEAFRENVKRAHLQVCIWRCALDADPPELNPTKNGWEKDPSSHILLPISTPPNVELAPAEVLQLIKCGCSTDSPCSSRRCGCAAVGMSCTTFCKCQGGRQCQNEHTKYANSAETESE